MSMVAKPPPDPNRVVEASFAAGATRADQLPAPVTVEVAFAGRSNVGKSSLLNAFMQRKSLVRTSRTPGCTRQINVFACKLHDGLALKVLVAGKSQRFPYAVEGVGGFLLMLKPLTRRVNHSVGLIAEVGRQLPMRGHDVGG